MPVTLHITGMKPMLKTSLGNNKVEITYDITAEPPLWMRDPREICNKVKKLLTKLISDGHNIIEWRVSVGEPVRIRTLRTCRVDEAPGKHCEVCEFTPGLQDMTNTHNTSEHETFFDELGDQ